MLQISYTRFCLGISAWLTKCLISHKLSYHTLVSVRINLSIYFILDFDAITDPIMKAKMVALKGINKVMVQNNMGMSQMVMNK